MRRAPGSIRARLLGPFVALTAGLVLITGLASGHLAAERARDQVLERGRGVAETLRRSRFPLTAGVLQQLKGLGGAEFALIGSDGQIGASTLEPATGGADAGALDRLARLGATLSADLSFADRWARRSTAYRVALVERPGAEARLDGPGRLLVLLPEPALQAAAWRARRAALVLSGLGAVLAAALASWLGRTLTEPLGQILAAIRQIGQGPGQAPTPPLPTGRGDEIGALADDVARLADRLRELEREREQTARLRLLHQVSAGLAHEVRNPLTAARMTIQLYAERNQDRDTEPLQIALSELSRVERPIARFLQLARPDPPRCRSTPVAELLERALAGQAASAKHQGTRLERAPASEADVPATTTVWADPEQIGQVLANLVRNGLEAAGPGGWVRLGARREGAAWIALEVTDSGPGPDPAAADRLFEPFVTTKPEGVGLGLAVSAALVREHGGSITWDRHAGGTRFRVVLPVADGAPPGPVLTGRVGLGENADR